jgi:hypothetical protein
MKNRYYLFLLSFLFVGCFDIIEELTINDDGSGSFEYTLNMSQSRKKLNSIRQLDSFRNFHIPTQVELDASINDGLSILKASSGIHNVRIQKDYTEYIFHLTLDFDTITDLNTAIQKIYSGMADRALPFLASFDYQGSSYERKSNFHSSGAFQNLNPQNRKILSTSTYINIVRFPSEVKAVLNTRAKLSGNKKAVFLKSNLLDLVDGKHTMKNTVLMK